MKKVRNYYFRIILSVFFLSGTCLQSRSLTNISAANEGLKQNKATADFFSKVNVEFMENLGQLEDTEGKPVPHVLFKAEAPGIDLYITNKGLSYFFLKVDVIKEEGKDKQIKVQYERIGLELLGASIKKENIVKEEQSFAYFNYLTGNPENPVLRTHKYKKITVSNVYPGIDWVLYNSEAQGFKYDFVLHPGADHRLIKMQYSSSKQATQDNDGAIQIKGTMGHITEKAPYTYVAKNKQVLNSNFKLIETSLLDDRNFAVYGFNVEIKDPHTKEKIVIDPQLVWATFYGSSSVEGTTAIETDSLGNIVCIGYGGSIGFPLLDAGTFFQSAVTNAFILKFNNVGTLLWATFFGGSSGSLVAPDIATDTYNNVFICGYTSSPNLPLVNANTFYQSAINGGNDAFISKFDALGNLVWSTFYGGSNTENVQSITCDLIGNVYISGVTGSSDFPLQNSGGYFESSMSNPVSGFLVKFDNLGNRIWSTFLKGTTTTILADSPSGDLYITGKTINSSIPLFNPSAPAFFQASNAGNSDIYILRFSSADNLIWGTYYGGLLYEEPYSVDVDYNGNLVISGTTSSLDFPMQNAGGFFQSSRNSSQDGFILKFAANNSRLWATYFGGSRSEQYLSVDNISIDKCDNIYLALNSNSRDLPFIASCDSGFHRSFIDTSFVSSWEDIYIARFNATTDLTWSTFFGGDGNDFRCALQVDKHGDLFVTGEWTGTQNLLTYPATNLGPSYSQAFAGNDDIYIAKFKNLDAPSVVQNFSYAILCSLDSNIVPVLGPGFVMGGSFLSSAGLSLDSIYGAINPSKSQPGTYTVSYVKPVCNCASSGIADSAFSAITVHTSPTLSFSGLSSVCVGQTILLSASGTPSLSWNSGQTTSTISVSSSSATTLHYTVTGTAANGCKTTAQKSVTVNKCTAIEEEKYCRQTVCGLSQSK